MSTLTAGSTTYVKVQQDGLEYAVMQGKTLEQKDFAFQIKVKDGKTFYVNLATRAKMWDLPDLAPQQSSSAPSATASTYKERVEAIYKVHNPEKLANVDTLLERYTGNEEQLIRDLCTRYKCSEPEVTAASTGETQKTPPKALSLKDRILAMYQKYKPNKIHTAEASIQQYAGQEQVLLDTLVSKWGPEPPAPSSVPTAQAAPTEAKPTTNPAPAARSVRERVVAMYTKYKPDKINNVDKALSQYAGQEESLIQVLVDKYGPEPEPEGTEGNAPATETQQSTTTEASGAEQEKSKHVDPVASEPQAPHPAEPQSTSQFAFGGTTTAENNRSAQEQMLLKFLSERDERIQSVMQRNDQCTSNMENLREQNSKLLAQMQQVKEQCELEVGGMKTHAEQLQQDAILAQESWKLEKEKVIANVDINVLAAQKDLNTVKIQYEEARVEHLNEKADLQTKLSEVQIELQKHQQRSGDLLKVLDSKDLQLQDLASQISQIRYDNAPVEMVTVGTQTEEKKPGSQPRDSMSNVEQNVRALAGSPSKSGEPEDVVISEFDELIQQEKARREEVEQWKKRALGLEHELQRLELATSAAATVAKCGECTRKQKLMNAMRQHTKMLEARIAELQLQLMSIPEEKVVEKKSGDTHGLQRELQLMQKELADARTAVKTHKKEIHDLRGLLSIHMSSPHGLRAVLTADSKGGSLDL